MDETAGQPDLAVCVAGQDDRAASDDGMAGGADTGLDVRPSCVAGRLQGSLAGYGAAQAGYRAEKALSESSERAFV